MASFNRVVLMGNLTRDAEVRFTSEGTPVCTVRLAVNERVKGSDGEWRERAVFVDVTIWGRRGEAFAKHHSRGDLAFFEGRLRMDQWDDKETGQKRTAIKVVAENWEFVGGERGASGGPEEPARVSAPYADAEETPF